jgi:excisionase family DNA binding protein
MPRPKIKNPLSREPVSRRAATKSDVAREQRVSLRTVDQWMHDRKIPYKKLGPRLIRFNLDEVERALSRYVIEEVK